VRAELLRILIARRAGEAIEVMEDAGFLLLLLGGVVRRMRFERLCQNEAALGLPPDAILRLAALGLFVEEDAGRLAEKLRLSTQEAKALEGLSAVCPPVSPVLGKTALEALLYRLGARLYLGRLLLAWATAGAPPDDRAWRFAAGLAASWQRPALPIGGADLIALGWKPGPALGAMLKELEEQWAAAGFSADRQPLLDLARQRAVAEEP